MRIAVLVKQIPAFEEMTLEPGGRLRRDGVDLEMNPYCRRAVSQGVALASAHPGSEVVVLTLGPPAAEDALREAVAWGLDRDVAIRGVLVSDPAFAGSDTLATAKALAAALRAEGDFDLVLLGRNSVDADTGQVPPELAELLGLPFLTAVRHLELRGRRVHARCELDDGSLEARVELPAVLSCAERLCEPAKVDPEGRAAVPPDRITRRRAANLGPGPWGEAASPTSVGRVRAIAATRARHCRPDAPLAEQVRAAVAELRDRGALVAGTTAAPDPVPAASGPTRERGVAVVIEPGRDHAARELLGHAARLAREVGTSVVACTTAQARGDHQPDDATLASWGADQVVRFSGSTVEQDVATALGTWVATTTPWAVLVGSTVWGREIAGRVAARLGAGLTGDAVGLDVYAGRLVAWKPAFGGQVVAAITASSPVQMVTVRAGVLTALAPRAESAVPVEHRTVEAESRVHVVARTRDDDIEVLADAEVIIGVGRGVKPDEYGELEPLRTLLRAELGATRKVTDEGWLPRARQIGITGRAVAPRLFVSIGASGKFNHTVGVRAAGTVLAINPDPQAPVFDAADIGIVGDWHDVVPLLVAALRPPA